MVGRLVLAYAFWRANVAAPVTGTHGRLAVHGVAGTPGATLAPCRSLASGRRSPHARTVPRLLQVFVWLMLATLLPQPAEATLPFQPAAPPPACDGVYLNPTTGRFWSMDSFEGHASDPLSLHKYLYAHGNPVNGIDPSGHEGVFGLSVGNAIRASIAGGVLGGISAGFTYAKTRSAEAAFQAGLNTYGAVFFSVAFPPAGLAIGTAGAISLGTHAWADGLTAMDAAEIATMFAASVALHASFQQYGPGFSNTRPQDAVAPPIQTFTAQQAGRITRILNYVVTEDGQLILGRKDNATVGGGHIDLAGGRPVLDAGEVKIVGGQIRYISNESRHYQPSGAWAKLAAIRAFKVIDQDAGGRYIEKSFDLPRPIEIPWDEVLGNTASGAAQGN